ncbi:hypothetical protein [Marinobacterium iners]|uniref:Uncharacterized protein n=1 Tax=Marinobacterium iners DSM 11526 TaxID=1122198 RepID=A0A1H4A0E9_9GAMM|nr:hypothetical protein [Marinobacterium iners]SEA29288.1 hypothetical protein SAMN02745729_102226 [Marinobacterium iners DSM 11526]
MREANDFDAAVKPHHRYKWILEWIKKKGTADILDSDFVYAYAEHFNPKVGIQPFGAPKCPQLSRDLGAMNKLRYLKRIPIGIADGLSYMGFPKWVYSYRIGRRAEMLELDSMECMGLIGVRRYTGGSHV